MAAAPQLEAITVTLNPALDRTLTIPSFMPGRVNRVRDSHERAGGKGVNVAAALADAGHRVAVTGFLGARNAARFESLFAGRGIADHFIRLPGETRVGIKIADPVNQQTTDINFAGLEPAAGDLAALRRELETIVKPGIVVILAGSLPPGVPDRCYADLTRFLHDLGARVLVDASWPALRDAVKAEPDILKPNRRELEDLARRELPDRAAVIAAATALLTDRTSLVVASLGEEGACFVSRAQTIVAVPPAVPVASTVGAGDALVAGLVSGALRGLPLTATARLATAFAVDRVSRLDPGLGPRDQLDAYAKQVRVDILAGNG